MTHNQVISGGLLANQLTCCSGSTPEWTALGYWNIIVKADCNRSSINEVCSCCLLCVLFRAQPCAPFAGAADALRVEVVRSAWYEAFRADMRSNIIVRAVEGSLGGVGNATTWTTSRLATASKRVM